MTLQALQSQAGTFPSLYVHFPFCESKCHYCDFYSLGRERTRSEDPLKFEQALTLEAAQLSHLLADQLDSIFFGGGTPSMTPVIEMERALKPLLFDKRVTKKTEWTMEANPSSVTFESLSSYRNFGVNRISMGVQALRPDLLKNLGRVHSREEVFEALENIFKAGFDNVSVDLLCGVPGQNLEDLQKAMDILTQYPITHLSCYLLTLPKHHRMFADLPNEDTQLEHLLFIDQYMSAKGFNHYEISNFAKPDKQARHNLNYWTGKSYLGLGPSAHSFDSITSQRWKNISSLHKYSASLQQKEPVIEWVENLTSEQKELERWMLGLRLEEGFPATWLDNSTRKNRASQLQAEGLLQNHPTLPGRLRLTARGFAVSDYVIGLLS